MESFIQPELLLTDTAIKWLQETHKPFCFTDFIGYIFTVDNKRMVAGSVDIFGNIKIFSCKSKKILSIRKVQKYIKKLVKLNFFEIGYEPFPEFSIRKNIYVDPMKTVFMEEPLFGSLDKE